MKKILFYICLAFIAVFSTFYAYAGGKAKISFAEKTYNFGTIPENGGSVSHDFTFTNTGSENLVIVDALAQCGCTHPEFPKNAIAPGKSSKVKVTYNPVGRPGAFEKSIVVKTNGGKVRLKITGTVIPK